MHPQSWCIASTRDDWLPRLCKFGTTLPWQAVESGRGRRGASLGGCSPASDRGQDPRGGGQDHQAHSGCPLWRIFQKGRGGRGLARHWRWRGVVGAGAGDRRWQRPLVKGRPSRRPRRAEGVGGRGWLGTLGVGRVSSPSTPAESQSLTVYTCRAHAAHPPLAAHTPSPPRSPLLLLGRGTTHGRGCSTVLGAGSPRPRCRPGARSSLASRRVLSPCPVSDSWWTVGTALCVLTASC